MPDKHAHLQSRLRADAERSQRAVSGKVTPKTTYFRLLNANFNQLFSLALVELGH